MCGMVAGGRQVMYLCTINQGAIPVHWHNMWRLSSPSSCLRFGSVQACSTHAVHKQWCACSHISVCGVFALLYVGALVVGGVVSVMFEHMVRLVVRLLAMAAAQQHCLWCWERLCGVCACLCYFLTPQGV